MISGLRVFVICFGGCFPHGLAFKFEAVSIVNDAVEDGIRDVTNSLLQNPEGEVSLGQQH